MLICIFRVCLHGTLTHIIAINKFLVYEAVLSQIFSGQITFYLNHKSNFLYMLFLYIHVYTLSMINTFVSLWATGPSIHLFNKCYWNLLRTNFHININSAYFVNPRNNVVTCYGCISNKYVVLSGLENRQPGKLPELFTVFNSYDYIILT